MSDDDFSYSTFLNPCKREGDRIHALLSKSLSRREEANLLSHMESCAACREFFEFMNRLNDVCRNSFEGHPDEIPAGLPKRIREEMGIALRESLARWLMESGKTLFLSQRGKADCVNYKTAPLPLSQCRCQAEKTVMALSRPESAGGPAIDSSFLEECRELCRGLSPGLSAKKVPSLIKECLDRSLELKPGDTQTVNLLGDHHLCEGKVDSAIAEFTRTLELDPSSYMKYSANLNLASAWFVKDDNDEASFCLSDARSIRDDALVNFNIALVYIYLRRDPAGAFEYLRKMDHWIRTEREFADLSRLLAIISSFISTNHESLLEKIKDFKEVARIVRRYRNPAGICS